MDMVQKKNTPAAATDGGAKENNIQLHITTTLSSCQILRGITAWASFLGLLGSVGGMENDTIGLARGIVQAAAFLIVWAVSLKQGGWIQ